MCNTTYQYDAGNEEAIFLPTFTLSCTLSDRKPEPEWVKTSEVMAFLQKEGIQVSKQTLFNMESSGRLHTRRTGPKTVFFNLHEIKDIFQTR